MGQNILTATSRQSSGDETPMFVQPLTVTQEKVMCLLLDSSVNSHAEIAIRLNLSIRTIDCLVQSIYDRLGLYGNRRNRFTACMVYVANNLKGKAILERNFILP